MTIRNLLLFAAVVSLGPAAFAQKAAEPINLAKGARATASSTYSDVYTPERAVDGDTSNGSRWLSKSGPGPHTLTLEFPTPRRIACIQMVSGWFNGSAWTDAIPNFSFEYQDAKQEWKPLPGTARAGSTTPLVNLILPTPVETDAIRLVATGAQFARVAEIRAFAPATTYPLPTLPVAESAPVVPSGPPPPALFVNQSGYTEGEAKRFTVPTLPDGTPFAVETATGGKVMFRGTVRGSIGDFTAFHPSSSNEEYLVVAGGLRSDAFRVAPLWIERTSLDPALRFMIDDRSIVGTHPSAYGGSPWRDGAYYTYEVPSLVMLYLTAPAFFDHAPVEMNYAADKRRVLAPDFKAVPANGDKGAIEAVRDYYTTLDAPVGTRIPDIVQLMHWGIGWQLVKPESADPSGDPAGRRVHPQSLEQFAFFLYAYPYCSRYFTDAFYRRAHDYAFGAWEKTDLFDVITKVGDFKGRDAPGHSILPNLLMYEVAQREKRTDASRFLLAAVKQAEWLVANLDPSDPRVTKGQRMSEHMTLTGLTILLRSYPASAPAGLKPWLQKWADTVIARSDNLWDFRRFDDTNWTLPRFTGGSHGGEGWNEVGNIAGFPACALSVADVLSDAPKAARLRQIATAHFDDLFGRNPMGAAAGRLAPKDYTGVERGWPRAFPNNVCARLELVRGTLNATASSEQYPYNPAGAFRHPEGWTAFNAAFNVGLAVACRDATKLTVRPSGREWVVELTAPFVSAGQKSAFPAADVVVTSAGGTARTVPLQPVPGQETVMRYPLRIAPGETVTVSYGFGIFAQKVTVTAPKRRNRK